MKLQHFLGGLEGLGPVDVQKKVFVEPWEKRIFGIHAAMMGLSSHLKDALPDYPIEQVPTAFQDIWTWADLRRGAEAMNPLEYFKFRYYEKWLGGISEFFVTKGYISQEELNEKTRFYMKEGNVDPSPLPQKDSATIDDQVIKYLELGDSPKRDVAVQPKFAVGDAVMVKDMPLAEHTRLPGHLRGKPGIIDLVYEGCYAYFPGPSDGLGPAQPSYSVRFDPKDIWGETLAEPGSTFYADLFEIYLIAA
ncbi:MULTISPECIES: nitrile hydratase subunit beta [Limnospira]|uniref:nitrile hydratase n=1 Tax=Limnospira indica PCC 8005 TaxID=376219 RepID=A0A9P1KJJ1_9CYAN|nr:nitrile hydratase subunit beta [Limnospira indica]CDM97575.1 Nitrile hydratase beta subunit [Limnospira indica PCC 8005]